MSKKKIWGVLAEFDSAYAIYHAAEKVRDQGFKKWDSHTPFPVHGLEKAMGIKPSVLPWIVLGMAILGGTGALGLQYWINVIEYPQVISAKPDFAWPAFVPVIFELTVLCSAFGAVFGMFHLNRLPTLYHPVFHSERFKRATDDRFFISIEAEDAKFQDQNQVMQMLKGLGAINVEILEP